ncbi:hypothetical protein D9758_006771 [Tetrapyrgos nigripes]|uniref:Uncharacterized protein n=1 Tax=Tetrapyrgos nigripes TaxID=182062 RepID=A0A8H5CVG7_9AGAR|nr:hypothetical protein D9758_006771 [Tetrapyrgos nigripes]
MLRAQTASRRLIVSRLPHHLCSRYASQVRERERIPTNHISDSSIGRDGEHKSIGIRTWDYMRSSADSLAIVQYLEKAFGSVEEFWYPREGDWYGSFICVRFVKDESRQRALEHKSLLQVPAPPPPKHYSAEGGITLSEIQSYVEPQKKVPNFDTAITGPIPSFQPGQSTPRGPHESPFLTFEILKESEPVDTIPPSRQARPFPSYAGRHFVRWGGFHNLKPIPKSTEFTHDVKVDHPVMRYLVRKYAQRLEMKNPYEFERESGPSMQQMGDATSGNLKWMDPGLPAASESADGRGSAEAGGWSGGAEESGWQDMDFLNESADTASGWDVDTAASESKPAEPVVEATPTPEPTPNPLITEIAAMAATATRPSPQMSKQGKTQVKAAAGLLSKVKSKPKAGSQATTVKK